jgi:hypothetical protein
MFGIREAQLEKHNPCKKKKAPTAKRLATGLIRFISEYLKTPEQIYRQRQRFGDVFYYWNEPI